MVRLILLALLIGLAGCQPAPPVATDRALAAGDWHRFEANFTAAGQRTALDLGETRHAAILELRGSMLVSSDDAPASGFGVQVIGFSDTETGFVGRAIWTDERGDKLFSALRGQSVQGGARIEGSFFGGTGRYAGAQGQYEFVWRYVLETEDGKVQGRAQDVRGRVRIGAPPTERPS
jgi:hypothetical protein